MPEEKIEEPSTRFGEIKHDTDLMALLGFISSVLTENGALQRDVDAAIEYVKNKPKPRSFMCRSFSDAGVTVTDGSPIEITIPEEVVAQIEADGQRKLITLLKDVDDHVTEKPEIADIWKAVDDALVTGDSPLLGLSAVIEALEKKVSA